MAPLSHIKICGLKTTADIDAAIDAGATMVGLVLVPSSPRAVEISEAKHLKAHAGDRAETVILVANQPLATLRAWHDEICPDFIQIHGKETDAERQALVDALPNLMLARGIAAAADLPAPMAPEPRYHLFDAKPPQGEVAQGGHGTPFDHAVLSQYHGAAPFLLAGGLTPETIADTITAAKNLPGFSGVDVSSGVESARGIKDQGKIRDFVRAARAAMGASCSS